MQILITVPYKQITEQRMAYFMKSLICNKIVQVLEGFPIGGRGLRPSQFTCAVRICPKNGPAIEYDISLRDHPSFSIPMEASAFVAKFPTDGTVQGAYIPDNEKDGKIVKLKVCNKKFLRETLNVVCDRPQNFWQSSPLLNAIQKKKIIVEFSSPNIAKPFHLGNLKSTIVGNFLSRMFEAVGHKVIRLNYLGDWGTQFGLLKHGYDAKNMSKKDLETQAIQKLCQLYIWANKEAEENPEVKEKAKDIFKRMELGDKDLLKTWQLFRDITIVELQDVYKKFNTYFDYYHGESMYNRDYCENIINMMIDKDILQPMPDGQKIYNRSANQKAITVVKSDGSTLYLTRDIAAAIHRHNSFNFDNMYYVVDSSQEEHFKSLINILNDLGYEWVKNITHVGFGRIHGMSTRKGTAVSLQDMLDEGVHLSLNHQKKSKYTPSDDSFNSHQTAENLVVSDLIAYCLNFKRSTQIPFSWKEVLQNGSGIGTRLQYIHCRLLRMEENCGVEFISDINEGHLGEPIVIDLIRLIARFDEVLLSSYQSMESSAFLDYMTKLSNAASTTYRKLPVKSAPPSVAEARLKLFVAARLTLACGMKVLGIEPMQRM